MIMVSSISVSFYTSSIFYNGALPLYFKTFSVVNWLSSSASAKWRQTCTMRWKKCIEIQTITFHKCSQPYINNSICVTITRGLSFSLRCSSMNLLISIRFNVCPIYHQHALRISSVRHLRQR